MRRLLMVGVLCGLGGCLAAEAPSIGYPDSGWRTRAGAALSIAEVEALRQSCAPPQVMGPIDSGRPTSDPLRDNPAYHPGGEGLANAPATGIAAAGRPIEPLTRRAAAPGAGSVDECLYGKGLVRAW
jgi:hypothetical protein